MAWVRVNGTGQDRFAIVCFKSAEHATRAVSVSQGKSFFGCKIQVSPYIHAKGEDILEQDEENRYKFELILESFKFIKMVFILNCADYW